MDDRSDSSAPNTSPAEEQQASEQQPTPPSEDPPALTKHPSHSPLAFSNYPPLWSKDQKKSSVPKPARKESNNSQAGASSDTLKAVLSTTSKDERRPRKQFNEQDPSNNHQYLQQPDKSYSHARLNIFGRDIGPLGKPPPLFRRKK